MLASDPAEGSPSAMHKELSQIAIAPFADPKQARLATRGMLPWDEAQPCGTLPAVLEMAGVTAGRHQGGGRQWSNPWPRPEAVTDRMGRPDRLQLRGIRREPFLQDTKLLIELHKELGT